MHTYRKHTKLTLALSILMICVLTLTACGSKVKPVIEGIEKISGYNPITNSVFFSMLDHAAEIRSVESLYNELSDSDKEEVTNYEDLKKAVDAINYLEEQKATAQEFGNKVFLRLAKCFMHPESINLLGVWYNDFLSLDGSLSHLASYTFQFTVKNSMGIEETVYYGNNMSFMKLTDEELSNYIQGFMLLGDGHYFAEGETGAMDSGTGIQLDAAEMMNYFRSNR